jgi:hypothetical protein
VLSRQTQSAASLFAGPSNALSQHPWTPLLLLLLLLLLLQDNVSIMEALTSLAVSLGPSFEPYATAVFDRTMQQLTAQHTALEAQVKSRVTGLVAMHC